MAQLGIGYQGPAPLIERLEKEIREEPKGKYLEQCVAQSTDIDKVPYPPTDVASPKMSLLYPDLGQIGRLQRGKGFSLSLCKAPSIAMDLLGASLGKAPLLMGMVVTSNCCLLQPPS